MDFQLLILDEVRAGVYVVPSSKNIMYNKYNKKII